MHPIGYTSTRNEAAVNHEKVDDLITKLNSITWGRPCVAHLVETPEPHRHVEREEVDVIVGRGFAGDHDQKSYYRGRYVPGREVSAVALEVLQIIDVDPLIVGDNLITEGIDLGRLGEGDVVQVGDVVLERSWKDHRPCVTFRDRTTPEAFSAVGRIGARGALFVVRKGGRIRRGDFIAET